jgi:hypothetical protein
MAGVPAQIPSEHFPNASLDRCRYVNVLGIYRRLLIRSGLACPETPSLLSCLHVGQGLMIDTWTQKCPFFGCVRVYQSSEAIPKRKEEKRGQFTSERDKSDSHTNGTRSGDMTCI